jgi:hypothetical protein
MLVAKVGIADAKSSRFGFLPVFRQFAWWTLAGHGILICTAGCNESQKKTRGGGFGHDFALGGRGCARNRLGTHSARQPERPNESAPAEPRNCAAGGLSRSGNNPSDGRLPRAEAASIPQSGNNPSGYCLTGAAAKSANLPRSGNSSAGCYVPRATASRDFTGPRFKSNNSTRARGRSTHAPGRSTPFRRGYEPPPDRRCSAQT